MSKGGQWVVNQDHIIRTYLRGWFGIDLMSIVPFWIVPFFTDTDDETVPLFSGAGANNTIVESNNSTLGLLRIVRIIRLLRLLKLARCTASRTPPRAAPHRYREAPLADGRRVLWLPQGAQAVAALQAP